MPAWKIFCPIFSVVLAVEFSVSGYFDPVGASTFTVLSMFRMEENAKIANLNRKLD